MTPEPQVPYGWSLGLFDDDVNRCECGIEIEEDEVCLHDRCAECRDAYSCCETCSVCHQLTDEFEVDEGVDPRCVDCAVAAMEREDDRRERDEAMRAEHGVERYV